MAGSLIATLALFGSTPTFASTLKGDTMNIKPGDLFLTRNVGITEEYNESPGYFNHAAIYVGNNIVVEAQKEPGKVIEANLEEFKRRYPIYAILRANQSEEVRFQAALQAKQLVGTNYRKLASFFFRWRKGENCVSVVRKSYKTALGKDPRWRTPDHIWADKRFQEIDRKEELST